MSERGPLPNRATVGTRLADTALLEDYVAGLDLGQIAERHGLGNPAKAGKAVRAALRRLDRRMKDNVDVQRAHEFLQLNAMTQALIPKMDEPKVAAELRLQSESRRRLYAVDLQREVETAQPEVHVHFDVPAAPDFDVEGEAEPRLELEP